MAAIEQTIREWLYRHPLSTLLIWQKFYVPFGTLKTLLRLKVTLMPASPNQIRKWYTDTDITDEIKACCRVFLRNHYMLWDKKTRNDAMKFVEWKTNEYWEERIRESNMNPVVDGKDEFYQETLDFLNSKTMADLICIFADTQSKTATESVSSDDIRIWYCDERIFGVIHARCRNFLKNNYTDWDKKTREDAEQYVLLKYFEYWEKRISERDEKPLVASKDEFDQESLGFFRSSVVRWRIIDFDKERKRQEGTLTEKERKKENAKEIAERQKRAAELARIDPNIPTGINSGEDGDDDSIEIVLVDDQDPEIILINNQEEELRLKEYWDCFKLFEKKNAFCAALLMTYRQRKMKNSDVTAKIIEKEYPGANKGSYQNCYESCRRFFDKYRKQKAIENGESNV